MKIKLVRNEISNLFSKYNISSDEVDKLLCESLNIDYSKLIFLDEISQKEYDLITYYLNERLNGKPLTKIFKKAYFYRLVLNIDENVLSPRQETEILVEQALKFIDNSSTVLDLCTGSGAIALAIKDNSNAKVYASDLSNDALKVAKQNADMLKLDVKFIQSNLFENINQKFDVIISNPPYIKTSDINLLDTEVKLFDPMIALDGGDDGLYFYKKIVSQLDKYLNKNGKILFEIGYNQADDVKKLLNDKNFDVKVIKDYSYKDRVIIGIKKD